MIMSLFAGTDHTMSYTSLSGGDAGETDEDEIREGENASAPRETPRSLFVGLLATICPGDQFSFVVTDENQETPDLLVISSTSDRYLAFKVKTTKPNRYTVRPNSGTIPPRGSVDLRICLQPGYIVVARDKFLVMLMDLAEEDNVSGQRLSELWNIHPKDPSKYMEHKLRCSRTVSSSASPSLQHPNQSQTMPDDQCRELRGQMEELLKNQQRIKQRISRMCKFQVFVVILLILLMVIAGLAPRLGSWPG